LIFAYLGEGPAPEFPLYPEFEHFDGFIEIDSYMRECNYFQNLENALDMSHVGFVHSDNVASFSGIGSGKSLEATESEWGVAYKYTRPDGQFRVQQFGMPNIFYMNALPTDPDIGWQESLFWWVPITDHRHMQFSIHRVPATGAAAERIHERRSKRRDQITLAHQDICEEILAGRMLLRDVDKSAVDLVRLQDDVAQVGQGRIADRQAERLGSSDIGVAVIRRLWNRELAAMLGGRAGKDWKRTDQTVPHAWALQGGAPARVGGAGTQTGGGEPAPCIDVRPTIEVDIQLKAMRVASHS
jgi:5,5'-dehydrodivanillate O-demethylase